MHQFGIRGRYGCIQKWKFWIRRKIKNDYQDHLLWMGTQTAARGVLAMYLQKSVILAATLCSPPREFHRRTNAFWKTMMFQSFRLSMHISISKMHAIHSKLMQLIASKLHFLPFVIGTYLIKIRNNFSRSKFPERKGSQWRSAHSQLWSFVYMPADRAIVHSLYEADKISDWYGFNVSLKRYWWP